MTALGDDTVPKILNSLYEYRVGKGLTRFGCARTGVVCAHVEHGMLVHTCIKDHLSHLSRMQSGCRGCRQPSSTYCYPYIHGPVPLSPISRTHYSCTTALRA